MMWLDSSPCSWQGKHFLLIYQQIMRAFEQLAYSENHFFN